jgi:PGDYG protein
MNEDTLVLQLTTVELQLDPAAKQYVKHETVDVTFAIDDGVLISREGPNHYRISDAIVTAENGDRWSVTRDRFEAKYVPQAPLQIGMAGRYQARPVPVWARQMMEAFTIARSTGGDVLKGQANDWLLQYAPGDYGVIEAARFARVYRLVAGK